MQSLSSVKAKLRQLKPALCSRYGVDTLGLFGSIVRDDFSEKSDIDIMVTFSRPIGIEFVKLADELEIRLDHKVDLVSKNGIKPRYLQTIEPEIIYV